MTHGYGKLYSFSFWLNEITFGQIQVLIVDAEFKGILVKMALENLSGLSSNRHSSEVFKALVRK